MIYPMPSRYGVGVTSDAPLAPEHARGFRYEHTGRYHNYHVTDQRWVWPFYYPNPTPTIIDGFSPNLNKELHVGHLRQLAVANSLSKIVPDSRMVALLGASLGVQKKALDGWKYWTTFLDYAPEVFYDLILPQDIDIPTRKPTEEEESEYWEMGHIGMPSLWDGPNGPVIVKRYDEKSVYAYHDLVFAKEVGPTHYITGQEQTEHFASLGFKDKHLPMGLVLGADGKKLKSRTGDALSATEAMDEVKAKLQPTSSFDKLAWNVLAWNFLHVSRSQNLKFEVEKWTQPEAPGLYVTYTYARVNKAIGPPTFEAYSNDDKKQIDIELMGIGSQLDYWWHQSIDKMDPAPLANYVHDLARKIGSAYHKDRISDGRPSFRFAMAFANEQLKTGISKLGMFPLTEV